MVSSSLIFYFLKTNIHNLRSQQCKVCTIQKTNILSLMDPFILPNWMNLLMRKKEHTGAATEVKENKIKLFSMLISSFPDLGVLNPDLYMVNNKHCYEVNIALKYSVQEDTISIIIFKCTFKVRTLFPKNNNYVRFSCRHQNMKIYTQKWHYYYKTKRWNQKREKASKQRTYLTFLQNSSLKSELNIWIILWLENTH